MDTHPTSSNSSDVTTPDGLSPAVAASEIAAEPPVAPAAQPQPSYVKLAMRNMVRKSGKSLRHFALTSLGLLAVLVGLAYLSR